MLIFNGYNLTLVRRFWATKVCFRASKISKICLFGRPTGRVTSWKSNFENYSRYLLIKWYKFLLIQKQPSEVFYEKTVFLEILQNPQENTCTRVSFFKVAGLWNFIRKETLAQVFSCEFLRTPFLQNTSGRLLLSMKYSISNTSFHFRHMFLLLACSSQSHTTSCSNLTSHYWINRYRPNSGRREKIKLNFYFHTSLWCLNRF